MIQPLEALILAAAATVAAIVLLRPGRGLLWRALRASRSSERVRIEDALKHLYDCEYRGTPATLHSLAGALGMSGNRAAELLARLEELKLVRAAGPGHALTSAGRSDALRVIRIHRLWERYLSDETGLAPTEWHADADVREHALSPQEVDALAARMGQPRFDPHGDPIPTSEGEIAPPRGQPMTELTAGEGAQIVHVEDEPEAVYAQLVAEGLTTGMRVRMLEVTPRRLRFEAEAEEHVLAPVVAANLSVVPLAAEAEEGAEEPFERLSALALGERARVAGLSAVCRGPERRRLLDLGIVPGTLVEAELRSPAGDPTAYRLRGTVVALRQAQADHVHVHRASAAEGAAS